VLELEVLVGELVAVDRLSTSAVVVGELRSVSHHRARWRWTHVTTLEHEVGDDSVETGSGVAEAVLAGAELSEVSGRLGDDVVVELEGDSARGGVWQSERPRYDASPRGSSLLMATSK
jgi:hypothetical protein